MWNALHIALRYLFARKKHNVINIISAISAAGIAIGSMALVLILSVYNGFDNSIREIYESYKADFLVEPAKGKTFEVTGAALKELDSLPAITAVNPVIEEKIFIRYGNREAIATIRGVETSLLPTDYFKENIVEGEAVFSKGEIMYAVIGQPLAHTLGLRVHFTTPIELYFPKKDANISIINPLESINTAKMYPGAIIRTDSENGENILYADASQVRRLTGIPEGRYSDIEIFAGEEGKGVSIKETEKEIQAIFPDCQVKDREEQNAMLYKMMKAEKFAVYLILFFVIGIISINIFSCLGMLMTDKGEDIETFMSMGATREFAGRIFHLHGFLISLLGCAIGTAAGIVLALLQQKYGIVTIPGNYLISAYPVEVRITDIVIIVSGVLAIGYIIAGLPVKKFFKN